MIQFYVIVFSSTFGSLLLLPYLVAMSYVTYRSVPNHHFTEKSMKLWAVLGWSIWTGIFVIVMLWSAWAFTNAVFSQ